MLTLNPNTKKAQRLVNSARYNKGRDLSDVYKSWSYKKENAMKNCREMLVEEDGSDFRIFASNCDTFSVAWNSPKGVRIETAYNSYLIPDTTL